VGSQSPLAAVGTPSTCHKAVSVASSSVCCMPAHDPIDEDALLALAFSLQSSPGAYALLIGAGVSIPSGVPSAWEVLRDLTSRIVGIEGGDAAGNPVRWYEAKFGEPGRYDTVLQRVAPTRLARQQLLRGYFEPSEEDVEAGRKRPTDAHRAVARMVRAGRVRVIVTLNFDRLIEQAIRDEGIEPTIVASADDAAGLAPLHTLGCCVIHLHGDYLNPRSMLNTPAELNGYRAPTRRLLLQVLKDYGLIIAGWSSDWDPALRQAIASRYPSRMSMVWIEPREQSDAARELLTLKRGLLMRTDADHGFRRLADAADAMANRNSRHPLTVPVAVETAKRELAGQTVAIRLHDILTREFARLHDHHDFHLLDYQDDTPLGGYPAVLDRVEEASKVCCALVATLARWGDDETASWWIDEIKRFSVTIQGNGLTRLLSLQRVVATALFYSAGIAALAGGKLVLAARLTQLRLPNLASGSASFPARDLDADYTYAEASGHGRRLNSLLRPLLKEVLALGDDAIDDAWQVFEVRRLAQALMSHPDFMKALRNYNGAKSEYEEAGQALVRAKEDGSRHLDAETRDLEDARSVMRQALQEMGQLLTVTRPHVLAADYRADDWRSPVAERLVREDTYGEYDDHRYGLGDDRISVPGNEWGVALAATSVALGDVGRRLALASIFHRAA